MTICAVGDLAHDAGRGLEQMRVLVRIAQDADDRDPVAADLPGDVAVEILRRHDGDLISAARTSTACARSSERSKARAATAFFMEKYEVLTSAEM